MYASLSLYIYIYTHTCKISLSLSLSLSLYTHTYIYIYNYIYTHTCICIYCLHIVYHERTPGVRSSRVAAEPQFQRAETTPSRCFTRCACRRRPAPSRARWDPAQCPSVPGTRLVHLLFQQWHGQSKCGRSISNTKHHIIQQTHASDTTLGVNSHFMSTTEFNCAFYSARIYSAHISGQLNLAHTYIYIYIYI